MCLLGKTSCGFPWRLLQTLSHIHMLFSVLTDQPLLHLMLSFALPVSLNYCSPGGALLRVWLERFYMESSSEIVVEFEQLISSQNRHLQY